MAEFKLFGLVPISEFRREMIQGLRSANVVLTTEWCGDRIVTRFREIPVKITGGMKAEGDE